MAAGPPDDVDQIVRAVQYLQGDGPPLLPRMYVSWTGAASTASALAQVQELAGIPWDLVLCYRDPAGDVAGWAGFAADVVRGLIALARNWRDQEEGQPEQERRRA